MTPDKKKELDRGKHRINYRMPTTASFCLWINRAALDSHENAELREVSGSSSGGNSKPVDSSVV